MNSIKYFAYFLIILFISQKCNSVLFFPQNSAFGIIAAIAVPLDLPHQNVFLSYNFEANYNYPSQIDIPPILNGIEDEDVEGRHLVNGREKCYNCTKLANEDVQENTTAAGVENFTENITTENSESSGNSKDKNKKRRKRGNQNQPLLSRLNFYHILQNRFVRSGYAGEACLLRLICETNASALGEVNGVLGTLIHILFSPTTSRQENIPVIYYQAEYDGLNDECHHYDDCKESLLELISTSYGNIIEEMLAKK